MSGLLDGKCALITGASSGIGLGIARVFAREGADLVVTCRVNVEGMHKAVAELETHGHRVVGLQVDISNVEEITPMIDAAKAALGRIDVLVNNAGSTARCPFLKVTQEMFDRVFAVNARGTYFCAQASARLMIEQGGGRIINISTFQTRNPTMNSSVYVATKGAIDKMTETMAMELGPFNIQVHTISPGCVPVEKEDTMSPDMEAALVSCIPYGRIGLATDIGEIAAFVASDRCTFMTGQRIIVDGGQSVQLHFPFRREENQS